MADVWDAVKDIELMRRGFDQERPVVPWFALPPRSEGETVEGLSRSMLPEDVRASFMALSEFAGWIARTRGVDPDEPHHCEWAAAAAEWLEAQARGLRLSLQMRLIEHEMNESEADPDE